MLEIIGFLVGAYMAGIFLMLVLILIELKKDK